MALSKIGTPGLESSINTNLTGTVNGFTPTVSNMAGRNLIVNGSMNVWQRGTSFPYSSFGGAGFCADRFWFYSYGGPTSGNVERSTDVPANEGFAYSLFNNTNSAMPSGTNVELTAQGMSAPFSVDKTYTLSFWVKSTSEINTTVYINWRNAHADGTNSTPAVATNPSYTIPTTWTRISLSFTLNAAPHANNRVLDFEYSHKAGMKITGVQLEEGSVATPFCPAGGGSYGAELALCQRYYWQSHEGTKGSPSGSVIATTGVQGQTSTGMVNGVVGILPVEMRSNGTASIYDWNNTAGVLMRFDPNSANHTGQSGYAVVRNKRWLFLNSNSGLGASQVGAHIEIEAEL